MRDKVYLVIGKVAFLSSGLSFGARTIRWRSEFSCILVEQRVRPTVRWYSKNDLIRGRTFLQQIIDCIILLDTNEGALLIV